MFALFDPTLMFLCSSSLFASREKRARVHLAYDAKVALQNQRFANIVEDLKREQSVWITMDNIDDKISPFLFQTPTATTGLVTKYSEMWRHYVESDKYEYEKAMHPEKFLIGVSSFGEALSRDIEAGPIEARRDVGQFLDAIIGTGEYREKYDELLDDFMEVPVVREENDEAVGQYSEVR
jgi:hypothetical protein